MKRVLLFVLLCLFVIQPQAQTRHTRSTLPSRPIAIRNSQDAAGASQSTLPIRRVILYNNGALTAFDLAEVRSVQLVDEGSRRDLSEFAHAAASARRRDAKTIVVTSDGRGERELLVSYTIAAPIWKTTYRVLLDTTGKPFFQGWAIVDNVGE